MDQIGAPSADITRDITKKFLEQAKAEKPKNDLRKKEK